MIKFGEPSSVELARPSEASVDQMITTAFIVIEKGEKEKTEIGGGNGQNEQNPPHGASL
jgi:hypothetical protein